MNERMAQVILYDDSDSKAMRMVAFVDQNRRGTVTAKKNLKDKSDPE